MGFLDWFKTTPKAVDTAANLIEKGASGIDKLFFTDEEKSDASQKLFRLWTTAMATTQSESTARSMTRRMLAVMIMGEFLLFLLMAVFAWPFLREWSLFMLDCARALGNLVLAIGVFYFGPYCIGNYLKKQKKTD